MEIDSNNAASKQTQGASSLLPEWADEAYRCVWVCVCVCRIHRISVGVWDVMLVKYVWVEDVLLIAL